MKIVFFGSDDFAAENLRELLAQKFLVAACVTQPDRPSGRGLQVIASPIKQIAQEKQIPVFQPQNLKDEQFISELKGFKADLFVVIAYGNILPSSVLKIPKLFCVNVHGSLLPKYRGAAPVNWAIINGEKETGFSLIKMTPKMDAGEIIMQEKMFIADDESAQFLRVRMAKQSAVCLCRTIKKIETGDFSLTAQDESKVTYAPKLTKELGVVDWKKSAKETHDLVRGLLPWPGAYTSSQGKIFKILQSAVVCCEFSKVPGTILEVAKEGIVVATGKDALLLKEVHPQSSKPMSASSFAAGQRIKAGEWLG